MVSIIIVNYNTRDLLRNCLGSIVSAGIDEEYEVIVVDNCSTDGSGEMVSRDFPSVIFINNAENVGFGRANNIGMRAAKGGMFFLLNPDAELAPGVVETLAAHMRANPRSAMAGPRVVFGDGSVQYTAGRRPTLTRIILRNLGFFLPVGLRASYRSGRGPEAPQDSPVKVECISAVALLVDRGFYEEAGGFDEHFFMYVEDVEWSRRATRSGREVWYVPGASVVHHEAASAGRSYREENPAAVNSMLYYFRKHEGRPRLVALEGALVVLSLLKILVGGLLYVITFARSGRRYAASGLKTIMAVLAGAGA